MTPELASAQDEVQGDKMGSRWALLKRLSTTLDGMRHFAPHPALVRRWARVRGIVGVDLTKVFYYRAKIKSAMFMAFAWTCGIFLVGVIPFLLLTRQDQTWEQHIGQCFAMTTALVVPVLVAGLLLWTVATLCVYVIFVPFGYWLNVSTIDPNEVQSDFELVLDITGTPGYCGVGNWELEIGEFFRLAIDKFGEIKKNRALLIAELAQATEAKDEELVLAKTRAIEDLRTKHVRLRNRCQKFGFENKKICTW